MIRKDYYRVREDGIVLYRTYSDLDCYIIQNETNIKFEEAIDIEDAEFTYTETNQPIERREDN